MSAKSNGSRHPPKSIDTLIGVGMRIEGDISCTGVLRVQGDVHGNVSCHDSPTGMLVVDSRGIVTGTVNATHVAVRGCIIGPVQSSQSIEIHQGGSLMGDVSFKEIAIHGGGVVDGLLNPTAATESNAPMADYRPQVAEASTAHDFPTPIADGSRFVERLGGARKAGAAALSATVAVALVWMGNDLAFIHPADDVALKSESILKESANPKSPPTGGGDPRSDQNVIAADAPVVASGLPAAAQDTTQPPPPDRPVKNPEKVVTVRGANPNRPAGVFLLISNEPSVLYRKKRDDPAEGARISVAEGEKVSISIAPDELIRIAQGRDVVILFQGQKVSRNTIESGSWISFAPR